MLCALSDETTELFQGGDYSSDCTGSQLYVSRYGVPLVDVAVGCRDIGSEMTTSTKLTWLCCSKPVLLIGLVRALTQVDGDEDSVIGRFIPEFTAPGKQDVTISHLLTHTVPYASLGITWTDDGARGTNEVDVMSASWADAVRLICAMPLSGPVGEAVTYTTVSNWHLLGEILQRCTNRPYEEVIRETVLSPLGMDRTCLSITEEGLPGIEFAPLTVRGGDDVRTTMLDSPPLLHALMPGLGCRGPAADLAKPIECVAGWVEPGQISDAWRAKLAKPRRLDLADPIFQGAEVQWSLGLCADPMCYGLPLSKRAVGYTGARSSAVFADLDSGITFAFTTNDMLPRERDWLRKRKLVRAIYRDLDLDFAESR